MIDRLSNKTMFIAAFGAFVATLVAANPVRPISAIFLALVTAAAFPLYFVPQTKQRQGSAAFVAAAVALLAFILLQPFSLSNDSSRSSILVQGFDYPVGGSNCESDSQCQRTPYTGGPASNASCVATKCACTPYAQRDYWLANFTGSARPGCDFVINPNSQSDLQVPDFTIQAQYMLATNDPDYRPLQSTYPILSMYNALGDSCGWRLYIAQTPYYTFDLRFEMAVILPNGTHHTIVVKNQNIPTNTNSHVTVVVGGGLPTRMYIDGSSNMVATEPNCQYAIRYCNSPTEEFRVGSGRNSTNSLEYFIGNIDSVRFAPVAYTTPTLKEAKNRPQPADGSAEYVSFTWPSPNAADITKDANGVIRATAKNCNVTQNPFSSYMTVGYDCGEQTCYGSRGYQACSQSGTCLNGACQCNTGFSGAQCGYQEVSNIGGAAGGGAGSSEPTEVYYCQTTTQPPCCTVSCTSPGCACSCDVGYVNYNDTPTNGTCCYSGGACADCPCCTSSNMKCDQSGNCYCQCDSKPGQCCYRSSNCIGGMCCDSCSSILPVLSQPPCSSCTCFGKSSMASDVCSGKGTCVAQDTCSCTEDEKLPYITPDCSATFATATVAAGDGYVVVLSLDYVQRYISEATMTVSRDVMFGWGSNTYGQLGDGTYTSRPVPYAATKTLSGVYGLYGMMFGRSTHTVLAFADYSTMNLNFYAFGQGTKGALGGSLVNRNQASAFVTQLSMNEQFSYRAFAAGVNTNFLFSSNGITVWGDNTNGALCLDTTIYSGIVSNPVTFDSRDLPQVNGQIASADTILGGGAVMLVNDASAKSFANISVVFTCGSRNQYGELGDGTTDARFSIVRVKTQGTPMDGVPIFSVKGGQYQVFALSMTGRLFGWGSGVLGSGLGLYSVSSYTTVPVEITTASALMGKRVKHFAVGNDVALILTADNNIYTFGNNSKGQAAQSQFTSFLSNPLMTSIPSGVQPAFVFAGQSFSGFVSTSGTLYLTGANDQGQIGNGDTTFQNVYQFTGPVLNVPAFQPISCFGIDPTNSSVCSGNGNCVGIDQCQCNSGYSGTFCQEFTCKGIEISSPSVCNGRGSCIARDTCSCSSQWGGSNCELPVCYGKTANSSSPACGGRGNCTSFNECACWTSYLGSECQYISCFGIQSNDTRVCSGHGTCGPSADKCTCATGWTGAQCQIPICFGVQNTSAAVCSGNGQCLGYNSCSCRPGYSGTSCNVTSISTTCFGIIPSDSRVCSGHGSCIGMNQCNCTQGYAGSKCDAAVCFGKLSTDVINVCSGNPCTAPNTCSCPANRFGLECQLVKCYDKFSNESSVCDGAGKCVDTNNCVCNNPAMLGDCSLTSCFGKNSSDPTVCSGKGTCTAPNQCSCAAGYRGKQCEQHFCFGFLSTDSRVCGGNGNCTAPDTCVCDTGYSGISCSFTTCSSVNSSNAAVCSSHGQCVEVDTCNCYQDAARGYWSSSDCSSCAPGYETIGSGCKTKTCSATTCIHGDCDANSVCQCHRSAAQGYWQGRICNDCATDYFGASCTTYCNAQNSCNGHGTCQSGSCVCDDDDDLGHFTSSNCASCISGWYGNECLTKLTGQFTFDVTGNALIGSYYRPYFNGKTVVSCSSILDAASLVLVGQNPLCSWPRSLNPANRNNVLMIQLGSRPTVNVGSTLSFRMFDAANTLRNATVAASAAPMTSVPIVSVKVPNTIDSCSPASIDATGSSSADRRDLTFSWVMQSGVRVDEINTFLATQTKGLITISNSLLTPGTTYTIQVTATSFFGLSASSTVTFSKSNDALAIASIKGPAVQTAKSTKLFILEGMANINMDCFTDTSVQFSWRQTSGIQVSPTQSQRMLLFPANTFPTTGNTETYTFELTTYPTLNPNAKSTATVTVQVEPQELVAAIAGGVQRLQSATRPLLLVPACTDPDNVAVTPTYYWSCTDTSTNGACSFGGGFDWNTVVQQPNVTLPAGSLSVGKYLFQLDYAKGLRQSSATQLVEVLAGSPPSVNIQGYSPVVNPNDKIMLLGSATSAGMRALKYRWTVSAGSTTLDSSYFLTPVDGQNLAIASNVLQPGQIYEFKLEASTDLEGTGYAIVEMEVNVAPQPGNIFVSPSSGTVGETSFTLTAPQWTDTNGQLLYQFSYLDQKNARFTKEVFLSQPSTSSTLVAGLPLGFGSDHMLTVRVRVIDIYGAVSQLETTVQVLPKAADSELNLIRLTQAASAQQLVEVSINKDPERAAQIANSVSSMLNSISSFMLPDVKQSASSLRENLLSAVVSTFGDQSTVIPISEDSIKLMSSTVSSVLSDPSQVTPASQQMAVTFCATLLSNNGDKASKTEVALPVLDALSSAIAASPSVESTLANATFYQQLNQGVANITKSIATSLLTGVVAGEQATTAQSSGVSVTVAKQFGNQIGNSTFSLGDSLSGSIVIPSTFNVTGETISSEDHVSMAVATVSGNPYLSDPQSVNISASVTSIKFLKNSATSPLSVKNLPDPIVFRIPGTFNISAMPSAMVQSGNFSMPIAGFMPKCTYWNERNSTWSTDGCYVKNVTSTYVECACTHLTDFSSFFAYFTPQLNILTVQDVINITKLNTDNMTTLIVVCIAAGLYIIFCAIFAIWDIILAISIRKGKEWAVSYKYKVLKITVEDGEVEEKKRPLRETIFKFLCEHNFTAVIFRENEQMHFNHYARLTILWMTVLGFGMNNALTYNTSAQNEAQWFISAIIATLLAKPFLIGAVFLFLKCRPRGYDRMVEHILQQRLRNEQALVEHNREQPPLIEGENDETELQSMAAIPLVFEGVNDEDATQRKTKHLQSSGVNLLERGEKILEDGGVPVFAQTVDTPKAKRKIVNPFSLILDAGDFVLLKLIHFFEYITSKMTWQGSVLIILASLVYVAVCVVLIVVLLPLNFSWVQSIHQIAVGVVCCILYVVFMEIIYIRVRMDRYREGKLKTWKPRKIVVVFSVIGILILFAAGILATTLLLVLEGADQTSIIQTVVVDVGLLILSLCVIVFLAVLYKKPVLNRGNIEKLAEEKHKKAQKMIQKARKKQGLFDKIMKKLGKAGHELLQFTFNEYWFPWYFQIIVFLLCYVYIGASSFVMILYGIKFDTDRQGPSWMLSQGTSLLSDIFVQQPAEFLVKGVLLVILIKCLEALFFPDPRSLQDRADRIAKENAQMLAEQAAENSKEEALAWNPQRGIAGVAQAPSGQTTTKITPFDMGYELVDRSKLALDLPSHHQKHSPGRRHRKVKPLPASKAPQFSVPLSETSSDVSETDSELKMTGPVTESAAKYTMQLVDMEDEYDDA